MKLSKDKLDEFIREELDANHNIEEVVNELEDIANSLDENLDRLKDVSEKTEDQEGEIEISNQVSNFYYQLFDKLTDLNLYIGQLKKEHDMLN